MANLQSLNLEQSGINLSELQSQQLDKYVALLMKWNKVYSLTAHNTYAEIMRLDILDGLSVVKYFNAAENILDIGSGMGVPGIILAIAYPQIEVTLIDSNSKKTAFLQQVKIGLGLTNLVIVNIRIENFTPAHKFNKITCRAFASLDILINLSNHLLMSGGEYLAMKSERGITEIAKLDGWNTDIIIIPGPDVQRFLIKIAK